MASIRETTTGYEVMYRSADHGRKCRDGCAKPLHQHSRKFTSEPAARKFKVSVEAGLSVGLAPQPSILVKTGAAPLERTFLTAALDVIGRKGPRGDWSEGTCLKYRSALTHLEPLHGRTVADVANARADVMSLIASLGDRGERPLYVIRAICRDAMNHGDIAGHRLSDIATPYLERRDIIPASRDQLQVIAAALDAWRPGAGLLVWVGDGLGLRHGEALALKVSDFRNGYSTVRVSRQIQRGKTAPLKAKRPGAYRDVPVSASLAERVRMHVASLGLQPSSLLFSHRGRPYSATRVSVYFREGAQAAGLPVVPARPAFTFHQLRHGFATRLLSAGVPISTVSAYLGHSALQTTETYSHVLPDMDAAARAILDAN